MKQSRYYSIEFWIDRDKVPFSPQIRKGVLDLMFNEFQGMFTPERYNFFEPVNKTFVNQDELIKAWNDDEFGLLLKKISPPKMNFITYEHTLNTTLGHHIYRFVFDIGKRVKAEIIEDFLKRMIDITKPSFCLATSDVHWDARSIVKYYAEYGTKQHVIFSYDERFCGIFWRTYFSRDIVAECNWGEIMDNLPCECQKMSDGYMIKAYDNCFDPDWEKEDAIIDVLGRQYIADIKTYYEEHNLIPARNYKDLRS